MNRRFLALLLTWTGFMVFTFVMAGTALREKLIPSGETRVIEIAGSTSVAPLIEFLAEKYRQKHPMLDIRVNATGSTDGIQSVLKSSADFGLSSRQLRSDELSDTLEVLQLTIDSIRVIVHPSNPFTYFDSTVLRDFFSGNRKTWPDDRPVVIVSREPGSGTRDSFEKISGLHQNLASAALQLDGSGAVRAAVARNPLAIGYVAAFFDNDAVQSVTLTDLVLDRPYYLLANSDQKGAALKFYNWLLSDESRHLISVFLEGQS